MTLKVVEINVRKLAQQAPLPQAYYDGLPNGALDAIEDHWPDQGGYVCILQNQGAPGLITIEETADLGIIQSRVRRANANGSTLVLAHSQKVSDRFRGAEEVRRQLRLKVPSELRPAPFGSFATLEAHSQG